VVISPILQVLNIMEFLQQVHSSGDGSSSPHPLLLPPDVFMEVGDIVFQLCDDPFEVQLRANYVVHVHHFCYYDNIISYITLFALFNRSADDRLEGYPICVGIHKALSSSHVLNTPFTLKKCYYQYCGNRVVVKSVKFVTSLS